MINFLLTNKNSIFTVNLCICFVSKKLGRVYDWFINNSFILYLKDSEQSVYDGVKIRGRCAAGEVKLASEELHAQEGEDEYEQEEK